MSGKVRDCVSSLSLERSSHHFKSLGRGDVVVFAPCPEYKNVVVHLNGM